jgi:pimeloyl-ACP methyl ester carboxylesterase
MVRRSIGRLAALVFLPLLASCALFDAVERELVFRPTTAPWAGYSPAILAEEEVWIPVGAEGERLNGWWLAAPGARYTLVYFHGARVNLTGSVYRLRGFRDAGFSVLAIDYRGYGRSSPRLPSEESVYEDAEAAWRWLDARGPERGRRILYGHSLGAPIAAEVARRGGGAAALVLESAFTSLPELTLLGGMHGQRMDLLEKLRHLDLPVLVVHGTQDDLVPPGMAQRLYEAARGPKRLVMVEGAAHSWVLRRAGAQVFAALRELAAAPR